MTIRTPSRRVVVASVLAVVCVLAMSSVSAAVPAPAAQSEPTFPADLLAPVQPTDRPQNLDITAIYGDPLVSSEDLELTVEFASDVQLPADGYRLSVGFGQPGGDQVVAVVRTQDGSVLSRLDAGTAGALEQVGPLRATVTGRQIALLLPTSALPAEGYLWASATAGSPPTTSTTPIFPLEQFLGTGPASVLSTADVSWSPAVAGDQADVLQLPGSPDLTVDEGLATLSYPASLPTEVDGVPVTGVVDVIRIAPDYEAGGQAPYLVAADYAAGVVKLLDATQPIPLSVDIDGESWLVEGSAAEPPAEGSVLAVDLDAVAEAFGIPMADDATAAGVVRTIVLEGGEVVQAEGVLGTLGWFAEGRTSPLAEEPVEEPVAPPASGDDAGSSSEGTSIGTIALVAALLAVAAIALTAWLVRRRGHRDSPHPNPQRHLEQPVIRPPGPPDEILLPSRPGAVRSSGAPRLRADTDAVLADLASTPGAPGGAHEAESGEGIDEEGDGSLFGDGDEPDRRDIDLNAINDSLFGHQR